MPYSKPLPCIDEVNRGFWENARAGRLAMQHCQDCGDMHFPPGPVCPQCLSEDQEWTPVSGRGRLESWVEFHRSYWPGFELPYRACLVKLEEGPILISNLIGPAADCGDAVRVVFDEVTEDVTLPKFEKI